jgi:trehalose utilization protein
MSKVIRVTVWNENLHEKNPNMNTGTIYPEGMHGAIANYLNTLDGVKAGTATLDQPEHGLTDDVLANTDVMTWWGHGGHHLVEDAIVEKVWNRIVFDGMGLIVLHSGHFSKIFKKLMGTGCDLKWREASEKERIWIIEPGHPIADGLPEYFELPHEEMYGERFDIPAPDALVMASWFKGGEVFRTGCCFNRGKGKIFYFRPGHETFPTYFDPNVQRTIGNAVRWAAPSEGYVVGYGNRQPLEEL